ncbi:MAG: serine/threonine protein kinase [Verrucomicrobia bacterium]|nr:serine/threonine protein kinase [Verrucomicrobiota bacterium]
MAFNESTSETTAAQPRKCGRFYLQELINSGGMAEIWVATDQDGATYAMKLMHKKFRFDFTARKRFVRGCDILSKIHNHEHVIGYIEHGKLEGTLYLLMEYVEASNLKLLFARQDEILLENVASILIDSAVALEHVHDSGFMHLDFKPENILVTRNAGVRLVDFDLALPKPDKPTKFSKNPGTPAYMSPQQLQREAFDARADIFSFGVMAYELLTYEKPFQGNNAEEILRAQLSGDLAPLTSLNPEIPPVLEKIVLKCLQVDPEKRYPYMSVVVRDLQQALYV